MDKLIQTIVEKTGISPEQAQSAVTTVLETIKQKLPAGIGDKITSILQDKDGDGDIDFSDILGGVKDSLGDLFGK